MMANVCFIMACVIWSTAMAKELTVIFLDGEKIMLNPPPQEMRTRVRDDGSRYEVIPGSVGLGYIVEELNSRMVEAKKKGMMNRCNKLQQLCFAIESQRKSSEETDIKHYGRKIKLSQEKPLLCSEISFNTTPAGIAFDKKDALSACWLLLSIFSGWMLCYCLYKGCAHLAQQSKRRLGQRPTKMSHRQCMAIKRKSLRN